MSTFGQSGPLAHQPGYDFIGQAYAGVTSQWEEPGEYHARHGPATLDHRLRHSRHPDPGGWHVQRQHEFYLRGEQGVDALAFGAALIALIAAERTPQFRFQQSPPLRRFFVTDLWYLATGAILLSKTMQAFALPWTGIFGESQETR